ncbi:hypothetical protein TREMEDRAFT_71908, partial [Tremella mesenterica DSM 1558]|uniref:uncharacterized protein n=1 Tax=Tremella mesenterica (strain ATCC 24925 / CBS 8224 / DSM 1558 / NBRC 9311 / NRRL Y-6157 / RJB 2259-6 / UBC 559-6) TaxID=578456 RepID=UPI0003F48BD8
RRRIKFCLSTPLQCSCDVQERYWIHAPTHHEPLASGRNTQHSHYRGQTNVPCDEVRRSDTHTSWHLPSDPVHLTT